MYGKCFSSLWRGSMRGQPDVQLVFIYLFSNCDVEGFADFVPEVIADDTGLELGRVRDALAALLEPDPRSRSQAEEGRRIIPIDDRDWGWRVVNHEFYKRLIDPDARREQWRKSQAKRRQQASTGVNISQHVSTHTDVDADVDAEEEKPSVRSLRSLGLVPEGFADFWNLYPRRVKRPVAIRAFAAMLKRGHTAAQLMAGAEAWYRAWEAHDTEQRVIPHPATFINSEQYLDLEEAKVLEEEAKRAKERRNSRSG